MTRNRLDARLRELKRLARVSTSNPRRRDDLAADITERIATQAAVSELDSELARDALRERVEASKNARKLFDREIRDIED